MSKQLLLALTTTALGILTIGVGLYVLHKTPVPADFSAAAAPSPQKVEIVSTAENVMIPKIKAAEAATITPHEYDPGTESWCEAMMLLPDEQWEKQDARIFAQNCIYTSP